MKLTKTNKSLSGTSYHGHVIKTTYNNLVKAFGPSHQSDGGYKTNHEWLLNSYEGTPFSIYDWKEIVSPEQYPDLEFEWHIGAFTSEDSLNAQVQVCAYLDSIAEAEHEDRLNYLLGYISDPDEAARYADMNPSNWPDGIPTENDPWKDNGPEFDSAGYSIADRN